MIIGLLKISEIFQIIQSLYLIDGELKFGTLLIIIILIMFGMVKRKEEMIFQVVPIFT